MPRQFSEAELNDAVAELDKVRKEWLKRPGVTGVDGGYKISGDRITDPARSGCSRPVSIVPPVVPAGAPPVGKERLLDDIMADLRRRR